MKKLLLSLFLILFIAQFSLSQSTTTTTIPSDGESITETAEGYMETAETSFESFKKYREKGAMGIDRILDVAGIQMTVGDLITWVLAIIIILILLMIAVKLWWLIIIIIILIVFVVFVLKIF